MKVFEGKWKAIGLALLVLAGFAGVDMRFLAGAALAILHYPERRLTIP